MKKRKEADCKFYCKGDHSSDNFVIRGWGSVSYCEACRTYTPNGKTIINFGYLYYK